MNNIINISEEKLKELEKQKGVLGLVIKMIKKQKKMDK